MEKIDLQMHTKFVLGAILAFLAASVAVAIAAPGVSAADAEAAMDTGDMSWIILAAVLVFLMAPGIALLYGGMLRKQSMTSVIAQCMMAMAAVFLIWAIAGYSLAFGGDTYGLVGGLEHLLMINVPYDYSTLGLTIPDMEFFIFQGMFALVTACIIVGATAERIRFPAIMAFLALWSVLVYAPMAHMVWGGGILSTSFGWITTLDFAGGTVVHICSAVSGIALAVLVGRRSANTVKERPHSIPLMFLGAMLLWAGWLGFNGGSALGMDGVAINAIAVTLVSSVTAIVIWGAVQYLHVGRISVTGMCAGCLAGLVAITPGAGFVDAPAAIIIGAAGATLCYFGVIFMRKKSGIDDALDVFGIHGVGGIWGAIATGIFAIPALTSTPGLLYGGADLFLGQFAAVAFTLVYCFAVSFIIIKVLSLVMRVRLTEDEEMIGSDMVEHGESAYN
jgi:Amt family ammonium transporter